MHTYYAKYNSLQIISGEIKLQKDYFQTFFVHHINQNKSNNKELLNTMNKQQKQIKSKLRP